MVLGSSGAEEKDWLRAGMLPGLLELVSLPVLLAGKFTCAFRAGMFTCAFREGMFYLYFWQVSLPVLLAVCLPVLLASKFACVLL